MLRCRLDAFSLSCLGSEKPAGPILANKDLHAAAKIHGRLFESLLHRHKNTKHILFDGKVGIEQSLWAKSCPLPYIFQNQQGRAYRQQRLHFVKNQVNEAGKSGRGAERLEGCSFGPELFGCSFAWANEASAKHRFLAEPL